MNADELRKRIQDIELNMKQLSESFAIMQGQKTECQLWISKIESVTHVNEPQARIEKSMEEKEQIDSI